MRPAGGSAVLRCVRARAADLHALDLQLHVVFSRRLSILPFLPAVSVLSVLHLLPVVQDDAAVLRPDTQTDQSINKIQQERGPQLFVYDRCALGLYLVLRVQESHSSCLSKDIR